MLEKTSASEQVLKAEGYFGCPIPGYVELCILSKHTVEPWITERVKGDTETPNLGLQSAFAAGFMCGSVAAQGKEEKAIEWLEKKFAPKKT